jgi:hypothetical protein
LSEACVRSLAQDSAEDSNTSDTKKGKEVEKREERVVIVDVNATGDGIVSSSSLSASWQVVNAEIAAAPTFEGTEGNGGPRLMLKIEGVGIEEEDLGLSAKGKGVAESAMGEEEMQTLLEGFDRKMGLLRQIVKVGEGWDEARRVRNAEMIELEGGNEV